MQQISIMGCGWLGLPLGKHLISKGYKIKGSTTSETKLKELAKEGIEPYKIAVTQNKTEGEINDFLKGSEILIINIPPKMRRDASEKFSYKIKSLLPHLAESSIKKVLFVSSTSVFNNGQGTVDETTAPLPETASGEELLLSEKLLQNSIHFKTTVLRFGGLTGPERHPVRYMAGRKNIDQPDAVVNLIHQNDCIGIIENIINKDAWGKTYHGVNPKHPTRKEYYTAKAKKLGLELPQFESTEDPSEGKLVESTLTLQELGYVFKEDV